MTKKGKDQSKDKSDDDADVPVVIVDLTDETYKHVIHKLLGFSNTTQIHHALQEISVHSARTILKLTDEVIMGLTYPDNGREIPVRLFFLYSLKKMRDFIYKALEYNNGKYTSDDIMNLIQEEWDEFSKVDKNDLANIPAPPTNVPLGPKPFDEYDHFMRGIKRDKNHYKELKDERFYDKWARSFLSTASTHHIEDVFNPTYVPPQNQRAVMVFKEKVKFAWDVLDFVLKTDMGIKLLRKYNKTNNAQALWAEYSTYCMKSTKAKLYAKLIMDFLTSSKFDDNFNGTATSFIIYWTNKMQEYDEYNDSLKDQFSDDQKLVLLQSAVEDCPTLNNVESAVDLDNRRSGNRMGYNDYVDLLLAAAARYDAKHKKTNNYKKKQQIHNYEINENEIIEYDNIEHEVIHIDDLLVNVMNRKPPIQGRKTKVNETETTHARPFIKAEVWRQTPKEVQDILLKYKSASQFSQKVNITDIANGNSNDIEFDLSQDTTNNNDFDLGGTSLLAHVTNQVPMKPGDIKRVLSTTSINNPKIMSTKQNSSSSTNNKDTININGTSYRKINITKIEYRINTSTTLEGYSLVDRGANGGVFGNDVRIIEKSNKYISLTGLNNHQETDLQICTGAGYTMTHLGPVVMIMHQYAYLGQHKTIHASVQLEAFKNDVDDKSRKVGGNQRVKTLDGYLIPLDIIQGLGYIKIRPPTDHEMETLPHVIMTSDVDWDPTLFDNITNIQSDDWYTKKDCPIPNNHTFNEYGDYINRQMNTLDIFYERYYGTTINCHINNLTSKPAKIDYDKLRSKFLWSPVDVIRKTFENTTQFAKTLGLHTEMRKHFRSRFPAFNVVRRNEIVATDTIYSDTPAIDNGAKCAQIFIGRDSLVSDVYSMKKDSEYVQTLQDNIRKRGAMDKIVSDRAKVEISIKAQTLLRALAIDDWQSEPHHQHQNFAERRYASIKTKSNTVLNRSGAPASCWFLCLSYVCFILNHMATESIEWKTPMQMLTGETSDISIILQFQFWEKVYYTRVDSSFPSESTEEAGHFVGFSESVGDAMTFMVLTSDTNKIVYRSNVRSADVPINDNQRIDPPDDTVIYVKSKYDDSETPLHNLPPLPGFNPSDLIGRSFLDIPQEDGQTFRFKIVKAIAERNTDIDKHPDKVKFLAQTSDKKREQIFTYREILDHVQRNNDDEDLPENQFMKFKNIIGHQGPYKPGDLEYAGSQWNVLVDWEDGECTYVPLSIIAADDPVTCATYAKDNNLLHLDGWKRFKQIARNNVNLQRMINQTRLQSARRTMRYKYGFLVPNNHKEAMELDQINGNTKWRDAEILEVAQLIELNTFIDKGIGKASPEGYHKIMCHMIYDVKHDGRHKARFVAGGHSTPAPLDSIYSGVVSLRGLRLVVFLAELNGLALWGADVGYAYLLAKTQEKVYIIAGPEFGDIQGHTLIVDKALYGLRSSGLRWHERMADILRDLGFFPSKADSDIWMRVKMEYTNTLPYMWMI